MAATGSGAREAKAGRPLLLAAAPMLCVAYLARVCVGSCQGVASAAELRMFHPPPQIGARVHLMEGSLHGVHGVVNKPTACTISNAARVPPCQGASTAFRMDEMGQCGCSMEDSFGIALTLES